MECHNKNGAFMNNLRGIGWMNADGGRMGYMGEINTMNGDRGEEHSIWDSNFQVICLS